MPTLGPFGTPIGPETGSGGAGADEEIASGDRPVTTEGGLEVRVDDDGGAAERDSCMEGEEAVERELAAGLGQECVGGGGVQIGGGPGECLAPSLPADGPSAPRARASQIHPAGLSPCLPAGASAPLAGGSASPLAAVASSPPPVGSTPPLAMRTRIGHQYRSA